VSIRRTDGIELTPKPDLKSVSRLVVRQLHHWLTDRRVAHCHREMIKYGQPIEALLQRSLVGDINALAIRNIAEPVESMATLAPAVVAAAAVAKPITDVPPSTTTC